MADLAALRESLVIEDHADLMAASLNFGEASRLMKEANAIRAREFGRGDPNHLRNLTTEALRA